MDEKVLAEWTRRALTELEARIFTGRVVKLLETEVGQVVRKSACCGGLVFIDRRVERSIRSFCGQN